MFSRAIAMLISTDPFHCVNAGGTMDPAAQEAVSTTISLARHIGSPGHQSTVSVPTSGSTRLQETLRGPRFDDPGGWGLVGFFWLPPSVLSVSRAWEEPECIRVDRFDRWTNRRAVQIPRYCREMCWAGLPTILIGQMLTRDRWTEVKDGVGR